MAEIALSRGLVALIDDADFELVVRFRWHAKPRAHTSYAYRTYRDAGGHKFSQAMHQFLSGYQITDHINGNGLDNRRSNLRPADRSQNQCNSSKQSRSSSTFKGVRRVPQSRQSWSAQIKSNGKSKHLGCFGTECDAALAYDAAARSLFGEYAALNFPGPGERCALAAPIALVRQAGPSARHKANDQKTHCAKGHAYDEKNTYRDGRGRRRCRACMRQIARNYYARRLEVGS